jgi:nucleotide-binding universal stress UspA family protein
MFRSIVVPIDLAEADVAAPALERAVTLAKMSGAKLTLVNVVPLMPTYAFDMVPVAIESDIADKARPELERRAKALGLPDTQVGVEVRIGGVYHEVLDVAAKIGADLIVVGSHRPAMSTYLLGSNATAIVRHALCSVLVVRV